MTKTRDFINPTAPNEQEIYNPDQEEPKIHSFSNHQKVATDEHGNNLGLLGKEAYSEEDGELTRTTFEPYTHDPQGRRIKTKEAYDSSEPRSWTGKELTPETKAECARCEELYGRVRYVCTQDGQMDGRRTFLSGRILCTECIRSNRLPVFFKWITLGLSPLRAY